MKQLGVGPAGPGWPQLYFANPRVGWGGQQPVEASGWLQGGGDVIRTLENVTQKSNTKKP